MKKVGKKTLDNTKKVCYNYERSEYDMPVCRNWQTRQTQNLLSARSCGFESHHRHQKSEEDVSVFLTFLDTGHGPNTRKCAARATKHAPQ